MGTGDETHAKVRLLDLSDAVRPARKKWGARIGAILRWSLAQGRPVVPDVLALILVARNEWTDGEESDVWTRIDVYHCLYAEIFNWCALRRVLVPDFVPETLWVYLHYLKDQRMFRAGSDPFRELLRPLRCYGGLDADGRPYEPAAHPRVRCVCKVPYRPRRTADET